MRKIIVSTLLISACLSVFSQGEVKHKEATLIHWMTFEEAIAKQKEQPKVIMIDMYTDWCGWCKKLDQTTFNNPGIADYINTYFYPVKFNAEGSDSIMYKEKQYTNTKVDINDKAARKSTHPLAIELMKGKMSYPTTVYIDAKENIMPVPGYMSAKDIEPLLVWFAEKINNMAPFDEFKKYFNINFSKDTVIKADLVKWNRFDKAVELCKANPKKLYIYVNSKYNNGGNIMNRTTLNNPVVADYLNENYYPIYIEAENTDTLTIFGQTYFNEQLAPNYPHQLVISILNKELFYPVSIFMNEQNQMINKIPGYLTPETFEPIIQYFGEDIMKTTKYDDFIKTFKSKLTNTDKKQ